MIWATKKSVFSSRKSKQKRESREHHFKAGGLYVTKQPLQIREAGYLEVLSGSLRTASPSCLLTGQEEPARSPREGRFQCPHPSDSEALSSGWGSLLRPRRSPSPSVLDSLSLDSQPLFYCFWWFLKRTEELSICLLESLPVFYLLHSFHEALFYLSLFAFILSF